MRNSRVFAIVLAGGEGKRLAPLTADRAKPAVPFGGNYRLVDFALSNLVNAGLLKIGVLTQYKSHSLDRHITTTWRLSPLLGNYVTPVPAQMRSGPRWFAGSADAIYQNLNLIYDERPAVHLRLRRRSHLPDGPAPDDRAAHRARRRDHGRGHPGPDRELAGVRGDRGRRRRTHDSRLSREAHGPGRHAGVARRGARLDGELRVLRRGADRRGHPRCGRRDLGARPRRQHHPGARRAWSGVRLGLREQQDRRRQRPGSRVLARRRDARRLLRRPHGPDLRRPDVQPLQRGLADPHLARAAASGEVRLRGARSRRSGDGLHGLCRRRRLRGHRPAVDSFAGRPRPFACARRGVGA